MHPIKKEEKMLGVIGWVGSSDVAEAGLWEILSFEDDSSHGYHKVSCQLCGDKLDEAWLISLLISPRNIY